MGYLPKFHFIIGHWLFFLRTALVQGATKNNDLRTEVLNIQTNKMQKEVIQRQRRCI